MGQIFKVNEQRTMFNTVGSSCFSVCLGDMTPRFDNNNPDLPIKYSLEEGTLFHCLSELLKNVKTLGKGHTNYI